ncbi:hypothetical protein [Bradyrhizobium sp. AUGA SZCCT0431]|uniref:hypothetical protein n=1 Tax=Bradyrhizobium sp. AUGA SZCCT0431 TaxID=2807674 RepID=UPI001BA95CCE|nr:hypothetical protein [Bradyrhizobium sp. AUGA SZCCT0431]MBR1146637.1 hypothetical protein [Bradyrhizobium sp. AUGA SZCCT0431]
MQTVAKAGLMDERYNYGSAPSREREGAQYCATTVGSAKRKRPAEAGRFCQLGIGVAGLIGRQLGIFVTLAGSLTLLARILTAALLLTRLLTRRLILLAGLVLVRHVVSSHGNVVTTDRSPRRSDQGKSAVRVAATM